MSAEASDSFCEGHLRGDDALLAGLSSGARVSANGNARDGVESVCILFAGDAGESVGSARFKGRR